MSADRLISRRRFIATLAVVGVPTVSAAVVTLVTHKRDLVGENPREFDSDMGEIFNVLDGYEGAVIPTEFMSVKQFILRGTTYSFVHQVRQESSSKKEWKLINISKM